MVFNLRSSCCIKAWEEFFAKHTAGQLIRVAFIPKATGMHRQIAQTHPIEASELVIFNFFSSFVFLSLSPLLSPSIMLCRTPCTILGREKKKRRRRKVGQGDLFFFPQFTEAEGGGVIVS